MLPVYNCCTLWRGPWCSVTRGGKRLRRQSQSPGPQSNFTVCYRDISISYGFIIHTLKPVFLVQRGKKLPSVGLNFMHYGACYSMLCYRYLVLWSEKPQEFHCSIKYLIYTRSFSTPNTHRIPNLFYEKWRKIQNLCRYIFPVCNFNYFWDPHLPANTGMMQIPTIIVFPVLFCSWKNVY